MRPLRIDAATVVWRGARVDLTKAWLGELTDNEADHIACGNVRRIYRLT